MDGSFYKEESINFKGRCDAAKSKLGRFNIFLQKHFSTQKKNSRKFYIKFVHKLGHTFRQEASVKLFVTNA